MNRRFLGRMAATLFAVAAFAGPAAVMAQGDSPDELVKKWSSEVLDSIKGDAAVKSGDTSRVMALVDQKIMPHVNFARMTSSAVGPQWRQTTPDQKQRLQDEFKTLLVRTYAGALAQVSDQTVELKPSRAQPGDTDVLVRTQVVGRGDPIQLDYRLTKGPDGWKIYNMNVLGIWMVDTYRSQFGEVINSRGIDGLISTLAERNKSLAKKS